MISKQLTEAIRSQIDGDIASDTKTLRAMSRDTSIFEMQPSLVVYPKNVRDVSTVARLVYEAKQNGEDVSIAARSAGTDMSGGPLTSSIVLSFTKYMSHVEMTGASEAETEPGAYYRDFEKITMESGVLLPSYPASREIAAMGGIISNDAGGEKTLRYGKTADYVRSLDVVLADGTATQVRALSPEELEEKKRGTGLEADIYRNMHTLLNENREAIAAAKPTVSKNSAGYALWSVIDPVKKTFDLSKLITGAQGTLALITKARLALVRPKQERAMLVVFLSEVALLPEVVHRVLKYSPESFESYDDKTFKLAIRFLPQIIKQLGWQRIVSIALAFIPEAWMILTGGMPKLILMAEFAEDTHAKALAKANDAHRALADLPVTAHVATHAAEMDEYWVVRRESFSLLRKNLQGLYAAPFIDDLVIPVDAYPEFLPALNALLERYNLIYTIAGHIGDGNFHIIPLLDLNDPNVRAAILELSPQVYQLVLEYHGSITGEHNDGIIRTPYLPLMFGDAIVSLFEQTKIIFDPLSTLNPGKKVGGTFADIERFMIEHV